MGYQQVQNKPTAAYTLSLLAGVFGLIAALAITGIIAYAFAVYQSGGISDYVNSLELGMDVGTFFAIAIGEGIWCLISSIIVLVSAQRLRSNPVGHTKWGALILIFTIIGLSFLAYQLIIGLGVIGIFAGAAIALLGFVGGILALVYKPNIVAGYPPQGYAPPGYPPQQPQPQQQYPPQPAQYYPPQQGIYYPPQQPVQQAPPQQITRICPNCGRVVDENLKFCPHCGKQLG